MSEKTWEMLSFESGTVALVVRDDRLCRVCFACSPEDATLAVGRYCPDARRSSSRLVKEVFGQLQEYFRGERETFDVRLDDAALSDFARNVHKALSQVPYGSVIAYRDLARLARVCEGQVGSEIEQVLEERGKEEEGSASVEPGGEDGGRGI
mgnify:CR=1 FL=1